MKVDEQALLQLIDRKHRKWVGGCSSSQFPTIQWDTVNSLSSSLSSFRPVPRQFAIHSLDRVDFWKIYSYSWCRRSSEIVCARHLVDKTRANPAILTTLCATYYGCVTINRNFIFFIPLPFKRFTLLSLT